MDWNYSISAQHNMSLACQRSLATLIATVMVVTIGCDRNPHGLVPVSGVVTYNGDALPGKGTVYFTQLETTGTGPKRAALGRFDGDGEYEASTFDPGDGVLPGKYAVKVHCWKVPPRMGGPPPVSYLPAKYGNEEESGLELVVEAGSGSIDFDIDIGDKP